MTTAVGELPVEDAIAKIKEMGEASATKNLVACWSALESSGEAKHEPVCDEIEEQLAFAKGDDALEAVIDLLGKDRVRTLQRPRTKEFRARALASRLGASRSK